MKYIAAVDECERETDLRSLNLIVRTLSVILHVATQKNVSQIALSIAWPEEKNNFGINMFLFFLIKNFGAS